MKKIIFIVIFILFLVAIPVTVFFVGQQQDLRSKAAPATALAFNPSVITKNLDDVFSLDVMIDSGGNNIAVAELHIIYDATKLEALSISNASLAPYIVASGTVGGGTASITVRAKSTEEPITGTGPIAIVRFKAIAATETPVQIKFDTTTFVSGLGESQPNVLVGTTPAMVTITGEAQDGTVVSPTPTIPSETATPTPPVTPTPTLQATQSATLTVQIQEDEEGLVSSRPRIEGQAPPGATVTIVIYSDPITVIVTSDANGNWVYTPTTTLASGPHRLTVTAIALDGNTETTSSAFTVSGMNAVGGNGEPMPASGNPLYTLVLLLIGAVFLAGSIGIQIITTIP